MRSNIGFLLSSAAPCGLGLNGAAAVVSFSSTNTLSRIGPFSQAEATGVRSASHRARGGQPPCGPARSHVRLEWKWARHHAAAAGCGAPLAGYPPRVGDPAAGDKDAG